MESHYPAILQDLKDAQQRLDSAIQSYLQCAVDIEIAASASVDHCADPGSLHSAILEANQDAASIPFRVNQLSKACDLLNRLSIRPAYAASINRLPSGVLARIFYWVVSGDPCTICDYSLANPSLSRRNWYKQPLVLSHVCKRWCLLAANTPLLWSHIGLSLGAMKDVLSSCEKVDQCIRHAYNSPLCICVDGRKNITESGMEMIRDCLRPHLKNLESFSLIHYRNYGRLLDLLTSWLTYGQAGTVHTLTVWCECNRRQWRLYSVNNALNRQRMESFLDPIRVLRLNRTYFDWDSAVYRNLVVLQLGNLKYLKLRKLLQIISLSPQLRSFQLLDMSIAAPEGEPYYPVVMDELEYLNIQNLSPGGLGLLLPQLILGTQRLSMTIDLCGTVNDAAAVRAFLSRNNIRRLDIFNLAHEHRIAEYLSSIGNLDTLSLRCEKKPRSEYNYHEQILGTSWRSSRCGKLHALRLTNGMIGDRAVKDLVEEHLRLSNPRINSCVIELFGYGLLSRLKLFVEDVRLHEPY